MIQLKLFEMPLSITPTLLLVGLVLLWVGFRVLKGVSVLYDVSPLKTYAGGLLFCLVCLATVGFYYDAVYAFGAYWEFIIHISSSLG
jgi:hypothetical protein